MYIVEKALDVLNRYRVNFGKVSGDLERSLDISLTAVAVRVLVGFNRAFHLSSDRAVARASCRPIVRNHFCSASRGTNSWCELLAVLIRSTSHSRSTDS